MNIQWFESLPSTNRYCESLDPREVEDFTCVAALEQTAGIGQRGNVWHSQAGSNLTFSLMLKPSFLAAERQFALTEMLSVAVVELLGKYGRTIFILPIAKCAECWCKTDCTAGA